MSAEHLLSAGGFSAAGVAAGIKASGSRDVGLLVCDGVASAAAVFTLNRVVAAPIVVARDHLRGGRVRGVVVNSGNANACTGEEGIEDALLMCGTAAGVLRCVSSEIVPASTGIIGQMMPMRKVLHGIAEAGKRLGRSRAHALAFADAILTTDTRRKEAAATVRIGGRRVIVAGVCKGSGMIGPRLGGAKHATMLAFLTTDAAIAPGLLRRMLGEASEESFNAVTVDDHASTNDMAMVLASGASGARVADPKSRGAFAGALNEVCLSLAKQIAADGEGATKLVRVEVSGARNGGEARAMARAIANSPLVKCAMNGNDPNWGRIVSAAGMCGARFDANRARLKLQGTVVFSRGRPAGFDAGRLSKLLDARQVNAELECGLGGGCAVCWTCDLSRDYVRINADYHT